MRFALSAMFAFSTSAVAATPIDKMVGTIGTATMPADRVDVPLYSAPSGYPYPSVQVTIGENQYLFKLDTGLKGMYVGSRIVKDQELKIRVGNKKLLNLRGESHQFKLGGERKFADLSELRIGELVLQDVVVSTKERGGLYKIDDSRASEDEDVGYDGVIGLASLPAEISWAIRPSVGQVSFTQGEAASGVVAGGTTVPYRSVDSFKYQYGTEKDIKDSLPLLVDLNIGGETLPTVLLSTRVGGFYYTEKPVPAAVNDRIGDIFYRHHDVSIGDSALGAYWMAEYTALPEPPIAYRAVLGNRVLHGFDMAVDRSASTLTLSEVSDGKWNDPREFLLAEALKAVEPTEDDAEGTATEEQTGEQASAEDAQPPGDAAGWEALKKLYISMGDIPQALAAAENVLAFDKRSCKSWIALGDVQGRAGDFESAQVSYQTASVGYHAWYDHSLEKRDELNKEWKKLDKEEKEASEYYPADSSCHRADGLMAAASFAMGDLAAVETLYRERFDLDDHLALVAGNALISQGDFTRAQEPLRQSLKQGGRKTLTRLALAMVYANTGDWGQASTLFDRSLSNLLSSQSVKVWLDALEAAQGKDAALAAAKKLAADNPESLGAKFGVAYILRDSEDEAAREALRTKGEAAFANKLNETPRDGYIWSIYARWLTAIGETERAESAARTSMSLSPGEAWSYIALSEVYAAKGEETRSIQYSIKAAQALPHHPGYAQLANTRAQ